VADGDAAGREDRRAVGELGFVAGRGSFVPFNARSCALAWREARRDRSVRGPLHSCSRGYAKGSFRGSCCLVTFVAYPGPGGVGLRPSPRPEEVL
jgi:hypothetical protein